MTEQIEWIKPDIDLPDDDTLVLFIDQNGEASCGIICAGCWYDFSFGIADDPGAEVSPPKLWAHIPAGEGADHA